MDEGTRDRAIFGGLALAALAQKERTSGRNTDNGDMTPLVGVDLSEAETPTK